MFENTPEFGIYARMALALGIGLIFGAERGWRQRERPSGGRAAGIRTFTLIGALGGVSGIIAQQIGELVIVAAFAALAVLFVAAYVTGVEEHLDPGASRDRSITTAVAALVTFALSVTAARGDMVLAAAVAVVCVAVLDLRENLHTWIAKVDKAELSAAIKLLLISVVVLPVLPNKGFGPGKVLNPYELWWIVVLVAGISFAGHAAVRIKGPRAGLLWTGVLGGLASSTAVAISCARLAAAQPKLQAAPVAGIAAATAVSITRTLILAGLLFASVLPHLAWPLGLAALSAVVFAVVQAKRMPARSDDVTIDPGPPPNLSMPLQFGLFLGIFSLAVFYAQSTFGDTGVYIAAALSGLIDVDAVNVSLSRQGVAGTLTIDAVTAGVVIAVAVNTIVKAVYAGVIAGRRLLGALAALSGAVCAALALGWAVG
ncbi:MAG: MgtC/SapB family protein [Rhodobacteraceae bacterium]|nr:MgtC/SapB family protein [Paracoccaceae bacterium]